MPSRLYCPPPECDDHEFIPIDREALRQALETDALRFYFIDEYLLEYTGELRIAPGDIDLSELVWGIVEDERTEAAAYLLRLLQAPPAERLHMANAIEDALQKQWEISHFVEEVAGSEQGDAYDEMMAKQFGAWDTHSEETEFLIELTSIGTSSHFAYVKRLRAGLKPDAEA